MRRGTFVENKYFRNDPASAMSKASKSKTEPASYAAAQQELEQLIAHIESGQLPLEQMLSGYQRAAHLLAWCRSRLDALQQQVQQIDEEGTLRPWPTE